MRRKIANISAVYIENNLSYILPYCEKFNYTLFLNVIIYMKLNMEKSNRNIYIYTYIIFFLIFCIFNVHIYLNMQIYIHTYIYIYWVVRKVGADVEGKLKRRKFKF